METESQLLVEETRAKPGRVTSVLANERTFLAYIRTALGFFGAAAGYGWAEFFAHDVAVIILAALGIVTLVLGVRRFVLVRIVLAQTQPEP